MLPTDPEPALLTLLERIAGALERISLSLAPDTSPNLVRPIADYPAYDWNALGATIVAQDSDGPTAVEWGGYVWTRRSPQNKFDPAIWYSRSAGKDDDGNVHYLRLITFKTIKNGEPIPSKTAAAAASSPVGAQHVAPPSPPPSARGAPTRTPPARPRPAPTPPAPAASAQPDPLPTTHYPLSTTDAEAVLTEDGKPYGSLSVSDLAFRFNGLTKSLKDNHLTPEQRAEKETKRRAAELLLAARKGGAAPAN